MRLFRFLPLLLMLLITPAGIVLGEVPATVVELEAYSRLFLNGQVRADSPTNVVFVETSPEQRAYLRFQLPPTPGGTTLSSASLYIDGDCGNCQLPLVSGIADSQWDILTLMAQFAPAPDFPSVTGTGLETAEVWDVTPIVQTMIGEGAVILVLSPHVSDPPSPTAYYRTYFDDRRLEPWLVLEYVEDAVKRVTASSWSAVKAQF